jgi:hypothetical protein
MCLTVRISNKVRAPPAQCGYCCCYPGSSRWKRFHQRLLQAQILYSVPNAADRHDRVDTLLLQRFQLVEPQRRVRIVLRIRWEDRSHAQTVDSGELISLYNLLRGIAGVPHDQLASSLIKDRLNLFVFLSDVHTVYMYLKCQIDVVVNKVRGPMVLR